MTKTTVREERAAGRPAASHFTVCVVAAEEAARERAQSILEGDGMQVGAGDDARWLASSVDAHAVDAVVVIGSGIDRSFMESLRSVRELLPHAALVAVVPSATARDAREALAGGAAGLVLERDLEACLAIAVKSATQGQLSLPGDVAGLFAKPVLSAREKQILGMVVLGFSNAEIARKLFLAEPTVKTHLSSIFTKLGVRSRSEAADLILDPHSGLGTGILAIVAEDERIGPPTFDP